MTVTAHGSVHSVIWQQTARQKLIDILEELQQLKAASSIQMSVHFCMTAHQHFPEGSNLHSCHCDNLKSQLFHYYGSNFKHISFQNFLLGVAQMMAFWVFLHLQGEWVWCRCMPNWMVYTDQQWAIYFKPSNIIDIFPPPKANSSYGQILATVVFNRLFHPTTHGRIHLNLIQSLCRSRQQVPPNVETIILQGVRTQNTTTVFILQALTHSGIHM